MKKGEVWLVEIPSSNGYEQLGNRPSAVIADTTSNVTVIIPFTSNIQALRFPFTVEVRPDQKNGLSAISVGLVFQIRAIDKKRLKKKRGELDDMMLEKIDNQLKNLLQLK